MASCKDMNMIASLTLMVVLLGLMKGATAAEYVVGDSLGWTLPPNTSFYSHWAASKTFQIGDALSFNWTGNHTMAETTKEEYDNCSYAGIWITSPVSTDLISAGSRYFYCTVGDDCEQGQKVTITVGSSTPTSVPSTPSGTHATPTSVPSTPSGTHATVSSILGLISSALIISFFT